MKKLFLIMTACSCSVSFADHSGYPLNFNLKSSLIARNADGSVRSMSQREAVQYCAKRRMHLPSAREWAQLAAKMGATGISDTDKKGYYEKVIRGYYRVNAINADGEVDKFSFSPKGYERPSGDLGKHWFLSSSVVSVYPDTPYSFSGELGAVFGVGPGPFAVRCAAGR